MSLAYGRCIVSAARGAGEALAWKTLHTDFVH